MAASQTTEHYQLPIYQPNDITSWMADFNGAMQKIDAAIYAAAQSGGSSVEVVQETGNSETAVMSQDAVTTELSAKVGVEQIVQTIDAENPSPDNVPSEAAIVGTDFALSNAIQIDNSTTGNLTNITGNIRIITYNGQKWLQLHNVGATVNLTTTNQLNGLRLNAPEGYTFGTTTPPAIIKGTSSSAAIKYSESFTTQGYRSSNFQYLTFIVYPGTQNSYRVTICDCFLPLSS